MSDIKKIVVNNSEYYFKDELVRNSIGVASGENNSLGIAPLDASGKVPSENLPSIPELADGGNDAARAYWGGDWRMPTTEEFQALGAAVNTAWTQVNNVYGILCTDKTDSSKTLFFPAAGVCGNGSVGDVGGYGYYYSSSLSTNNRQKASSFYFDDGIATWDDEGNRNAGFAVRPILDGTNANGHDYVEIGGIKWATMNIGASSISDYGLYFAWGDTQGYTADQVGSGTGQKYFGWADYKYGNGTSSPGATGMTKYNATDGKTVLELSTPVEYLHKVAVTGDYNDLSNKPDLSSMIETTYSNLVSLRNNSQLIPGKWYRITDYVTTTAQAETQSAGHPFDVIVYADSVNVLNENAYAALHSGDTYFANSKLEAWKLKYCIDNDRNRFLWADTTNGKGVIWEMTDEYGNTCPYDFKNIMFARYQITACENVPNLQNTYNGFADIQSQSTKYPSGATIGNSAVYRYTFDYLSNGTTSNDLTKYQATQTVVYCHDNKIAPWYVNNNNRRQLNNITMGYSYLSPLFGNEFGENDRNMAFGIDCCGNRFGTNVCYNSIGNNF